ncbi:MAG: DUF2612 domain-containing protein [Shewanella sp.]
MSPNCKQDYALSQVINQLSESPNYLSIIKAIARTYDDQDAVLSYIATLDVYTAKNVWLDLIGSIVGIGRRVDIDLEYEYFGYTDINNKSAGYGMGRYWTYGSPSTSSNLLADEEYRKVIIAKAAQNSGGVNHRTIVEVMQMVLDTDSVLSFNGAPASVDVYFEGQISKNMLALIKAGKILPTAAGVGLRLLMQYDRNKVFGYGNISPKAKGYGKGAYPKRIN